MDRLSNDVEGKIEDEAYRRAKEIDPFDGRDFRDGARFGFRLGVEMAAKIVADKQLHIANSNFSETYKQASWQTCYVIDKDLRSLLGDGEKGDGV